MKAEIFITVKCKDAEVELTCCIELPFAPTVGMRLSCFCIGGEVVESIWWHETQAFEVRLAEWFCGMDWGYEATRLMGSPGWKLRHIRMFDTQ